MKVLSKILSIALLIAMPLYASAQNITVKGNVKDAAGLAVIGASVIQQGTSNGVITDIDGNYSINVPANATLQFSSIGYVGQDVAVAGQNVINVVLEEDAEMLEETVVIGYGVQKKSDLTGAVGSLRGDELKKQSTTDAAAALQGKVAGVYVITDAAPGAGANIRVRGTSSNSGNLSPIFIVDGLQVSSIQYLDPSMIESMEVLKDAASAAIYGAEAGNGVVLVTTKKGETGTASVTYSGKATMQNYTRRPLMNRSEFLDWMEIKGYDVESALAANDYNHKMYDGGVIDTDWIGAYIEPTWSQQHSISFQGGNNKGHFFTSLNYVYNNGVVKGDRDVYKRLTAQINADYQLFKWLQVGTNNSIEKWSTNSVSQRGYSSSFEAMWMMDPLTPVYWTTPDEMSVDVRTKYDLVKAGDPNVRPYRFLGDENGFYANTRYADTEGSPIAKIYMSDGTNGGINVNGTLYANLMPVKGLTITSRFGYRINTGSSHSYTAPYYIGGRGSQDNYSISASTSYGYYYQWENFANYTNTFAQKHTVTAMAGMSFKESFSDGTSANASGPDILKSYEPNFIYMNYVNDAKETSKGFGNAPNTSASLAYFGRLIYSYDNRYSIQANFRADAFDSSKLPSDKRWGYFPSISAGWTVSNEPWFRDNVNPSAVNFLKLRASWGRNGNISVLSGYPYATTIALGNDWYQYGVDHVGSEYSSSPNGLPNPNLTWETSEQVDLGLDARFLNNRLTLGIDYYNKQTKDWLISVTVPAELGVGSTTINAGKVYNTGIEFELGWRDHVGDFSYAVNANFSYNQNKVAELPEGTARITAADASSTNYQVQSAIEVGYPVWYMRGFKYAGMDAEGKPQYYTASGEVSSSVGSEDLQFIGQGTPKFNYGLNINLAWKGIDLAIYGAGLGGNVIMPVMSRTGYKNDLKWYLDNYKAGNAPSPKLVEGDYIYYSSTANIFKGDFFRIKQLQLGYTLPSIITKKAKISDLRFYVSLDDFFTFTSYPGLDPETASTNNTSGVGLDWGSYPTMKKLIFGVNITF